MLAAPVPQPPVKTTSATEIYRRIRHDVLTGAFRPGARLHIQSIAADYGTSVNPVREALNRLAAEKIVEQRDQRGFRVPPITREGLEELVRTRCWLEALALREAMARRDEKWELDVVVAFHKLARTPFATPDGRANPTWEERHRDFHMAMLANCGSSWLLGFCDDMMFQAARVRFVAVTSSSASADRLRTEEHQAIMDAAIGGDEGLAVDLLTAHYRRTLRLALDAIGPTLGG